jgi:hypothetical protein
MESMDSRILYPRCFVNWGMSFTCHGWRRVTPLNPLTRTRDFIQTLGVNMKMGRAIAQAVSRRLPTAAARVQKPGSGHVAFCDGQKWRWGRFSPRTLFSPANLHSICFSTIIFTIIRGWHNRPGVAAVPTASQTK